MRLPRAQDVSSNDAAAGGSDDDEADNVDESDSGSDAGSDAMPERLASVQSQIDSAAEAGLFASLANDPDEDIQQFLHDVSNDPTQMLRYYNVCCTSAFCLSGLA